MKLRSASVVFAVCALGVLSGCQGGQAANQEKLDEFSLPTGYGAQGEDQDVQTDSAKKNVASEVYSIPEGADPCADLEKAFRAWTEEPINRNDNRAGCSFNSFGQDQKALGNVNVDQTRVLVVVFDSDRGFLG